MFKKLMLIAAVVLLSGCEHLGGAWTKRSSIAFEKNTGGSLSVWNAEMSAAVAYSSGQICMQRALAVKNVDADTSLKISEALVDLAKAIQTTAVKSADLTNPNSYEDTESLIALSASLKETVNLLTTSTERTTYLDLGMFYTCQISANGGLTDTQTAELLKVLFISGAAIDGKEVGDVLNAAQAQIITPDENFFVPVPEEPRNKQ